jgi:hypothetical protein
MRTSCWWVATVTCCCSACCCDPGVMLLVASASQSAAFCCRLEPSMPCAPHLFTGSPGPCTFFLQGELDDSSEQESSDEENESNDNSNSDQPARPTRRAAKAAGRAIRKQAGGSKRRNQPRRSAAPGALPWKGKAFTVWHRPGRRLCAACCAFACCVVPEQTFFAPLRSASAAAKPLLDSSDEDQSQSGGASEGEGGQQQSSDQDASGSDSGSGNGARAVSLRIVLTTALNYAAWRGAGLPICPSHGKLCLTTALLQISTLSGAMWRRF